MAVQDNDGIASFGAHGLALDEPSIDSCDADTSRHVFVHKQRPSPAQMLLDVDCARHSAAKDRSKETGRQETLDQRFACCGYCACELGVDVQRVVVARELRKGARVLERKDVRQLRLDTDGRRSSGGKLKSN